MFSFFQCHLLTLLLPEFIASLYWVDSVYVFDNPADPFNFQGATSKHEALIELKQRLYEYHVEVFREKVYNKGVYSEIQYMEGLNVRSVNW